MADQQTVFSVGASVALQIRVRFAADAVQRRKLARLERWLPGHGAVPRHVTRTGLAHCLESCALMCVCVIVCDVT